MNTEQKAKDYETLVHKIFVAYIENELDLDIDLVKEIHKTLQKYGQVK